MQHYTGYYTSPVGVLRISCSETAIHAVLFAEEAGFSEEHELITACTQQLDAYFSGKRKQFDLPLQQAGTAFQSAVWQLLLTIPFGRTLSYHALAQQYGDVKAIRAVAAANGKNNLAIIVPCHRVIGSDHSLTGYAGGLWRKKWLLEHESKHYHGVAQPQLFL